MTALAALQARVADFTHAHQLGTPLDARLLDLQRRSGAASNTGRESRV